jgi:hypothetical protein
MIIYTGAYILLFSFEKELLAAVIKFHHQPKKDYLNWSEVISKKSYSETVILVE